MKVKNKNWNRLSNKSTKKKVYFNRLNKNLCLVKEPVDDADDRSVFVKNVDYSAEPAELKEHF